MKRQSILLFAALLTLSACQTTSVYIGEEEGRRYVNQSVQACETIRFMCEEGVQPFFDETGCGCEPIPLDEVSMDASETVAVLAKANEECGFIDGEMVNCEEPSFCATVQWISSEPAFRCVPLSICNDNMCGIDSKCVIMESWPAKVVCVPLEKEEASQEGPVGEPAVEEAVQEETSEEAPSQTVE